jgi:D-methionine transport system ATP-binding protein
MPDARPIAMLENVSVRYGETRALETITLSIERGEIIGVIGESGAGKSTLLDLLDAVVRPSSGRVLIEDTDPHTLDTRQRRILRRRIGMVFQNYNLLSNRTVRQNISLPLALQRRKDPELVDSLLNYVDLHDRAHHFPAQLSGGQKQRVAIARALVTRPGLILCDEPTSALDTRTTADILELLANTRRDFGATIVLVTHELDAVGAICDRAAVLERGVLRSVIPITRKVRERKNEGSYLEHALRVLSA